MSVEAMCALAHVGRAGYYRFLTTPAAGDKDIDLRDAIQRIALEFPNYGRPRITAELHRPKWRVGPNPLYRIMREDNLLCLRRFPSSRFPVGPVPGYRTRRKEHALTIARDEFRSAIPRRVARQRCPFPFHRHCQHNPYPLPGGTNYHQTVYRVFTVCLAKRGNPKESISISLEGIITGRWHGIRRRRK
ncbi:MAG TPA: IS3 family transposase [Bryobacteraceae bacterium]|nr:IS3 family transposase [Bryobacteraceae bacterium]